VTDTEAFYERRGEDYQALTPATGPWDKRFQNGAALSGLLAHILETGPAPEGMDIARYQLDILRPAPMDQPLGVQRSMLRDGRRLQATEAALLSGGDVVARASLVRLRHTETPAFGGASPPPDPDATPAPPMSTRRPMRGILQSRLLSGGLEDPGPGAGWYRFDGDIVAGAAITPFVAAAMTADFGSALSSVLDWREYTFANVDISLHLTRAPRGPWLHVDAHSVSHGAGRALVNAVMSDQDGDFARAHQTLFVDARN